MGAGLLTGKSSPAHFKSSLIKKVDAERQQILVITAHGERLCTIPVTHARPEAPTLKEASAGERASQATVTSQGSASVGPVVLPQASVACTWKPGRDPPLGSVSASAAARSGGS